MKNIKMLIIIVCTIIVILITTILLILNIKKSPATSIDEVPVEEITYQLTKELRPVEIRNDFYVVKTCIEKFYSTYANIFNNFNSNYMLEGEALESIKREQNNNITAIYNMLDEDYIKYASITKENLLNKLPKINEVNVEINDMYVSEQKENLYVYIIYGNLLDIKSNKNQDFYAIVKTDMKNKTFKIYLQDYVKAKYANLKTGDNIQISVEESIKNDIDNVYQYKVINDETYITDVFNTYKRDLLYNRTRAYKLLNTEYSTKKFGTQLSFENYVKSNIYKLGTMTLSKYQKKQADSHTQYICVDQNQNYYIFNENGIMNFNVILDTYTINLPEFTERYNKASDEEKVLLNIQKCFAAINDKDYNYVYSKLDNTFKSNNFKTLADFQKYISSNFFEKNEISASNARKQGDIYMYDIKIRNEEGTKSITKTFVMRLNENTDFVMSFGV